ncbi:MAG: metallopeptidase family protein [Patescibacteria group bacterium]
MEFTTSTFDKYISQAMASLPQRFNAKLKNLALVIDDQSQPRQGSNMILGNILRSNFYPNKITFFKKNIESISPNEKVLAMNLYHIFHHEIGHYFGMSEGQLRRKEQQINIYAKHAPYH